MQCAWDSEVIQAYAFALRSELICSLYQALGLVLSSLEVDLVVRIVPVASKHVFLHVAQSETRRRVLISHLQLTSSLTEKHDQ